jgi:hypothetical protein
MGSQLTKSFNDEINHPFLFTFQLTEPRVILKKKIILLVSSSTPVFCRARYLYEYYASTETTYTKYHTVPTTLSLSLSLSFSLSLGM